MIIIYHFCFADASFKQGFLVKVLNWSRDWSCIQRCSATWGRYGQVVSRYAFFYSSACGDLLLTRPFYWLADFNGNHFSVFTPAISRWTLLCWCHNTLSHSCSFWSSHFVDQPSYFWDSRHQVICMGKRIQTKDRKYTKVRKKYLLRLLMSWWTVRISFI